MILLALTATRIEGPLAAGLLHGLKIAAVAIVAQAVWGMSRSLCPDRERASMAVAAVLLLAVAPGSIGVMAAIILGGIAGAALRRGQPSTAADWAVPVSNAAGIAALACFSALLVVLPLTAPLGHHAALVDSFYRAGSLVFGGGHVVLPLLEAETVRSGWVSADSLRDTPRRRRCRGRSSPSPPGSAPA